YHRGLSGAAIPMPARVLAAADVPQTTIEAIAGSIGPSGSRDPNRPALDAQAAADHVRAEVAAGRIDARAAVAVLESAGHERPAVAPPYDLTPREVEVLGLIARGL